MPYCYFLRPTVALLLLSCLATVVQAAAPSDQLLPDTTKGYLSVDDVDGLIESFEKTQIGKLVNDPVMEPFLKDFKAQLKGKWGQLYKNLGLTLEDLEDVPGGETALGLVHLKEKKQAALVIVVDVTGHMKQANELLKKVDTNLLRQKAKRSEKTIDGTKVILYRLPPKAGVKVPREAAFFIRDNTLCGSSLISVAEAIVPRFAGTSKNALRDVVAYQSVMARAKKSAGDMSPDLRWFGEPFGFVTAYRILDTSEKKKGKDLVKILNEQGFDAIQGVGGYVNLYVNGHYELMHRTAIYAPQVPGVSAEEKYTKAARMLRFPNGGELMPQPWVPRELASYISFNWEVAKAFEYSNTLVDAVIGEEGVFDDVIESIEKDPNGPQINIRKDLLAYLGTRVTVTSDYLQPIDTKCERMVMAVDTNNEEKLRETVRKTMSTDPDARERDFNGIKIWEIVDQQEGLPAVEIEGLGGVGFDPIAPGGPDKKEKERKLPSSAVCVANGHLYIATHIEFLKIILGKKDSRNTLAGSVDYKIVMDELARLTPSQRSFRVFSRNDEELRPTYELIRMGKMPESETLFGKLLNAWFSEGDDEEVRPQKLNGDNLPNFEMVRRYFGPSGMSVTSEPTGWFMLGITLNKEAP